MGRRTAGTMEGMDAEMTQLVKDGHAVAEACRWIIRGYRAGIAVLILPCRPRGIGTMAEGTSAVVASGIPSNRRTGIAPSRLLAVAYAGEAPPHARGSPPRSTSPRLTRAGSPACAGIAPSGSSCAARRMRLPRMRGDRPDIVALRHAEASAPPHARGMVITMAVGSSAMLEAECRKVGG